jgi:carbonic anhydrase
VAEDVRRIRESPFIADDIPVSGFVYDVRTGRLKEVVGPTAGQAA